MVAVLCIVLFGIALALGCDLSEFGCKNGYCISADRYCDEAYDCPDRSDEPRDCSVCNRTYYATVGSTYELNMKLPTDYFGNYECQMTLIAGGKIHGEIIQEENEDNGVFALKFQYRSLNRPQSNEFLEGERLPQTRCSKIFEGCDQRPCRVTSPNYPGHFPSNVTCFYHIRQSWTPAGKIALIQLFQKRGQGVHLEDTHTVEEDDNDVDDKKLLVNGLAETCGATFAEVYDGPTVHDKLLAKFCGVGKVPNITSSSNQLLLVFRSSNVSNFYHPLPFKHPPGFEIMAKVLFHDNGTKGFLLERNETLEITRYNEHTVDKTSFIPFVDLAITNSSLDERGDVLMVTEQTAANYSKNTELTPILSEGIRRSKKIEIREKHGSITSPLNTLGSGDFSINYVLRSTHSELIWLSFARFHVSGSSTDGKVCAELLENSEIRLSTCEAISDCSHTRLPGNPRPCMYGNESFVSKSSEIALKFMFTNWTFQKRFDFELSYEFVDVADDCHAQMSSASCSKCTKPGLILSPKSYALFRKNIHLVCNYTFDIGANEYLSVFIGFERSEETTTKLELFEDIENGLWINRELPASYQVRLNFSGKRVRFRYTVERAAFISIPIDHYLELAYSYHNKSDCGKSYQFSSPFGETSVQFNASGPCKKFQIYIHPSTFGRSVIVEVPGFDVTHENGKRMDCPNGNRLDIYSGAGDLINVICPDWRTNAPIRVRSTNERGRNKTNFIVLEAYVKKSVNLTLKWFTIRDESRLETCRTFCPEFGCISDTLWCDGTSHCANNTDETSCPYIEAGPLFTASISIFTSILVIALVLLGVTFVGTRKELPSNESREHFLRGFEDYKDGFL